MKSLKVKHINDLIRYTVHRIKMYITIIYSYTLHTSDKTLFISCLV